MSVVDEFAAESGPSVRSPGAAEKIGKLGEGDICGDVVVEAHPAINSSKFDAAVSPACRRTKVRGSGTRGDKETARVDDLRDGTTARSRKKRCQGAPAKAGGM